MKRSIFGVALAALLLTLSVPTDANAQIRLGVHGGLNTEGTDLFIGATSQFGLTIGERELWGSLGLDIYPFIYDVFTTRINANGLFPLLASGSYQIYGGGGVVIQLSKFDVPAGLNIDETDTDFGLNLVGGVLLGASEKYRPFLELNQTIGAGTDFAVRVGAFFRLGN
jgi:opacity protein-like surface antigen